MRERLSDTRRCHFHRCVYTGSRLKPWGGAENWERNSIDHAWLPTGDKLALRMRTGSSRAYLADLPRQPLCFSDSPRWCTRRDSALETQARSQKLSSKNFDHRNSRQRAVRTTTDLCGDAAEFDGINEHPKWK